MPNVLTVSRHYLPGYRGGGPIRTIANVVGRLGDEHRFTVLAADRDLGDATAYPGIAGNPTQEVGKAEVRYLPRREMQLPSWRRLLGSLEYDAIYLNSYFDPLTIQTLLLRRFHLVPSRPVILAPRGEFSPGALAIKTLKKRPYIALARLLRLYEGIVWQASSEYEKQDIMAIHGRDVTRRRSCLHVASDLAAPPAGQGLSNPVPSPDGGAATNAAQATKEPGSAKVAFLSRISRKKNLDFALKSLRAVKRQVQLDVYGPLEDRAYWDECQGLMARLPPNVRAKYVGVLRPEDVIPTLAQYHAFLFPTRGENFGHVILEALSAGCLPIISDQTPWRNLAERKAGWDLPLEQPESFTRAVEEVAAMDQATYDEWRRSARARADAFRADPGVLEANRQLFEIALKWKPG